MKGRVSTQEQESMINRKAFQQSTARQGRSLKCKNFTKDHLGGRLRRQPEDDERNEGE